MEPPGADCDDANPCTDPDVCNGSGLCPGEPIEGCCEVEDVSSGGFCGGPENAGAAMRTARSAMGPQRRDSSP